MVCIGLFSLNFPQLILASLSKNVEQYVVIIALPCIIWQGKRNVLSAFSMSVRSYNEVSFSMIGTIYLSTGHSAIVPKVSLGAKSSQFPR